MDAATCLRSRHEAGVLAYFVRRTGSVELAWELAAETWAAVQIASLRMKPDEEPPAAWLFAVARETLCESLHAGCVADRARRRRGTGSAELTEAGARWVRDHATASSLAELVEGLEPALREAVMAPLPARDTAQLAEKMRRRRRFGATAHARPERLSRLGLLAR